MRKMSRRMDCRWKLSSMRIIRWTDPMAGQGDDSTPSFANGEMSRSVDVHIILSTRRALKWFNASFRLFLQASNRSSSVVDSCNGPFVSNKRLSSNPSYSTQSTGTDDASCSAVAKLLLPAPGRPHKSNTRMILLSFFSWFRECCKPSTFILLLSFVGRWHEDWDWCMCCGPATEKSRGSWITVKSWIGVAMGMWGSCKSISNQPKAFVIDYSYHKFQRIKANVCLCITGIISNFVSLAYILHTTSRKYFRTSTKLTENAYSFTMYQLESQSNQRSGRSTITSTALDIFFNCLMSCWKLYFVLALFFSSIARDLACSYFCKSDWMSYSVLSIRRKWSKSWLYTSIFPG